MNDYQRGRIERRVQRIRESLELQRLAAHRVYVRDMGIMIKEWNRIMTELNDLPALRASNELLKKQIAGLEKLYCEDMSDKIAERVHTILKDGVKL